MTCIIDWMDFAIHFFLEDIHIFVAFLFHLSFPTCHAFLFPGAGFDHMSIIFSKWNTKEPSHHHSSTFEPLFLRKTIPKGSKGLNNGGENEFELGFRVQACLQ
ncbi:hypothetical protein L1887_08918 [Cichorium endivia]|nr:hypothetical protein L1887_08918 [Cichorium endivia]